MGGAESGFTGKEKASDRTPTVGQGVCEGVGHFAGFLVGHGGVYTGVFTPTEAAAVGAFLVLCLGLIGWKLSLVSILEAFKRTLRVSVMILTLIVGANMFSYFLALTTITTKLSLCVSQMEYRLM